MSYYVYILECADTTLYVGYTNNLEKRIIAHNYLKKGARYTRARRPVVLKYFETFAAPNEARRREYEIKQWKREEKLNLFSKK